MKRQPITQRELEEAYRLCLERERDRVRKAKLTEQGKFESSVLHFDFQTEGVIKHGHSTSWLSDRGKGAWLIRRAADQQPKKSTKERQRRINRARMAISRHLPECLMTFWLVLKNGNNREESIWELMQKIKKGKMPLGRPQKPSTLHNSKKS